VRVGWREAGAREGDCTVLYGTGLSSGGAHCSAGRVHLALEWEVVGDWEEEGD